MKAELRFLSGARSGQAEVLGKAYLTLGRDPLSDVRFDAERDLNVSSRHAAIIRQGNGFVVRDLGSTNGTFVNGQAVKGDVPLGSGDVIRCGTQGPSLEFRILEADATDEVSAGARASAEAMSSPRTPFRAVPAPPPTPAPPPSPPSPPRTSRPPPAAAARSSTGVRIAAEVARQTRGVRRTTKVLLAALCVSVAGFGWVQWNSVRNAREVAEFQSRADSLNRAAQQLLTQLETELQSVRDALGNAQAETERLRSELAAVGSGGDPIAVARLRSRLDSAEARQRGLADATRVDYRRISQQNADAVALVIVKFSETELFTGTAFAVDSQGTMVTNKHVLVGEEGGRQPLGIAVKFSGSKQWFQGRLVGVSDAADVAVLKVDIRGGTPRVVGFAADSQGPQRGDPVAIIGYPLGEELPMERRGPTSVADPTLTVGTVSKVLHDLVQVDGYGAPGSSGSPIFGQDGRVIAVLYGGNRESQGRIIYGVPGGVVVDYLKRMRAMR